MTLIGFSAQAQIILKGVVVDSAWSKPLSPVRIENLSTHQGVFSNEKGEFSIEGKEGDYILFTYVGFRNKSVSLTTDMQAKDQRIILSTKPVNLKTVTIRQGPTEYQKDSAKRASLYQDAFEYKQTKSLASPVSSVYQALSKKHKSMRRFQDQIIDLEKQKFIETKYNQALVSSLTKLSEEEAYEFMRTYPMEFEYARTASDLEIKMWIKFYFQEYQKKNKASIK